MVDAQSDLVTDLNNICLIGLSKGALREVWLSADHVNDHGRSIVKYVLFYDSADDVQAKAPLYFAAHRARLDEFHARGTLLMVGTFANPQEQGSMSIFTTREAAEEFARGDPFVLNGVVRGWRIWAWNEILAQT